MKKINIMFTLAVILFSLVGSYSLNAAQVADSVCVVTVSKDEKNVIFSAENGFVDPAKDHPESYLFTNCKYVKFVKGKNVKDTDLIEYESSAIKNIQYYHDDYTPWAINNCLTFGHQFYISTKGDEGSCKVDGAKLIIRKSAVLDSVKVTLSYSYGKEEALKDSVINMTLPVDSKNDVQIYNTASSINLKVERPVLGKIAEVAVDTAKFAVGDNYFSGKSFRGEIKPDVKKIQITTYTIDGDYNKVKNELSLNVVSIDHPKRKKSGGIAQFLKKIWWIFILIVLGAGSAYAGVKYGPKFLKTKAKKDCKTQSVNTLEMVVGEKIHLPEDPGMLKWGVLLEGKNGKNLHLNPTALYKNPFKCNSSEYTHIIIYDTDKFSPKDVEERLKKGKRGEICYKVAEHPELAVLNSQNGSLALYSINRTNDQKIKLNTPSVSYESKDSKVVRVVLGNEIKAESEGETYVYFASEKKRGWHIVVKPADAQPMETPEVQPEVKPEGLNPQVQPDTQSDVQPEIKAEVQPEVHQEPVSDVDRKQLERLQNFAESVMQAVAIDSKKILENEGDDFDKELKNVVSKISSYRSMFKMIDEYFVHEYDQSEKETKVNSYKKKIDALKADSSALKEINEYLKIEEESKAIDTIKKEHALINYVCTTVKVEDCSNLQNKLNALMSADANYCALKTKIAASLKFDGVNEPEHVIEKAAERVDAYNQLDSENTALKARVQTLEEYEAKYNVAAEVHESNRSFYLSKLTSSLKQIDDSMQRISSNVLSSSQIAEMVSSIYASTGGFKPFYEYVSSEDWTKLDKIVDIKDAISKRLDSSIGYDRSWVNGIARFYAYLRVPQLEAHLASSGISKMDFDAAFNAMTDLYTILCDYTEIIVPSLFVDVYNPDIHYYDEQAFGNVISAVCSEYDSFRDNSSALSDLSKLGYRKSDGTYVKPEVIF